jgi:putative transposase
MAKTQTLSFPIRLPASMQAETLRMLDESCLAINQFITDLWGELDAFATDRSGSAWKQVERHLLKRSGHGSRQERNEMEQAGRILRAQATRKQLFAVILPLLTTGLIIAAKDKRPAHKDHRAIREQVRALQQRMKEAGDDAESFMALTNLLEQVCNRYLRGEPFPSTYEELQDIPVLSVGQITFAGDDGMVLGQTYRASVELVTSCNLSTRKEETRAGFWLKLRMPDTAGKWRWGAWSGEIRLPANIQAYLEQGATPQAPTLREICGVDGERRAILDLTLDVPATCVTPLEQERRVLGFDWGIRSLITVSILDLPDAPDGPYRQVSRPVFLDTGGFDGRQARLRREIARLTACKDRYQDLIKTADSVWEEQETPRPPHYQGWQEHVRVYESRIKQCWLKYERRNKELAHLSSNLLILLATVYNCRFLSKKSAVKCGRRWYNSRTYRPALWCANSVESACALPLPTLNHLSPLGGCATAELDHRAAAPRHRRDLPASPSTVPGLPATLQACA